MRPDRLFFMATAALIVSIYVLILATRRWPQIRFRVYVLNLVGLALCGYTVALTSFDTVWMAGFLLNLTFQNALLAGDRRITSPPPLPS